MANFPPLQSDFQSFFVREFAYGSGLDAVQASDINRALGEAGIQFNASLFDKSILINTNYTEGSIAYLYLAAHILAKNLQGSGGLHSLPQSKGATQHGTAPAESKTVGGVSVSYAILELARQTPALAGYLETDFGKRYLTILYPRLIGNVAVVSGQSLWYTNLVGMVGTG